MGWAKKKNDTKIPWELLGRAPKKKADDATATDASLNKEASLCGLMDLFGKT